ncbi:hypothetical protein [Streptomyces sp. NPDC057702]|uniref:hypothetical protein n=1 Tax=unclassified Streptomyces TaxID=2593676 RepID=UPI0036AA9753
MKSIITARMKTAALAGATAAALIAGAANVSSDGTPAEADKGQRAELSLASEAAASLPKTSSEQVRVLEGSGRASRPITTGTTKTLASGQRLTVETVCLGTGSVTVTATAGGPTRTQRVRCVESGTHRAETSRFTLTTQGADGVRIAVRPNEETRGGLAFRVHESA